MINEEKLLIEKVIKGDIESFEKLIKNYQLYAYNIAYRILGNEEDAKDATQEALIKVYKSINKFEMKSSFSTWLYRIVVNTAKDQLKSRGAEKYSIDDDEDSEKPKLEIADQSFNPEKVYEKNESSKILHQSIGKLPQESRIALVLRDIQGFTYEEISEMITVPIGTVKSRIARGRSQLKKILMVEGRDGYELR